MAKVIYTFDLNDPDDNDKIAMHEMSEGMWLTLWDLDQWLREEIKYKNKNDLQGVRDMLYVLMDGHNVNLDRVS